MTWPRSIADPVFAFDAGFRYAYWNRASEILTGIPAGEALGRSWEDVFPDQQGSPADLAYREVMRTRLPRTVLTQWSHEGLTHAFEIRIEPAEDGILVVAKDVTARVRAENTLAANGALLKGVLDSSLAGIMSFRSVRDASGTIVDFEWTLCNATAERIEGRAAGDLQGRRLLVEMPGNREDGLFGRYVTVVETGLPLQLEHFYEHEKVRTWFETSAVRHCDGLVVTFTNITARKQAEQGLRDSETRYRTLFDSMDAAVLLMRGPECIACNPATLKLFGLERFDQFLGRTPLDFAPILQPDGTPSALLVQRNIELAVQRGTQTFEWQSRRANGYPFEMEVRFTPLAIGEDFLFQCIALDITQRKRAEEALRESEERFRKIFEEGPLGIATSGPDFRFTRVNQAFCQMTGFSEKELLAMTFRDLTLAQHLRPDIAALRQLAAGEIPLYNTEKQYRRKTGEVMWGAAAVAALRHADGEFRAYLTMIEDITDSKIAEAMLAAEKERLAVTLRCIADGVVTTDIEGRVALLNRAAEELTGWTQVEAAGKPLRVVFPIVDDRDRLPCPDPVERVLALRRTIDLEDGTLLLARGGAERALTASISPIHDRQDRDVGTVLVFRDVTDRNRMEAEVQRAQKLESVGLLAGGIAHDFNNLLTGILGSVALARIHATPDSPQADWLYDAEKAVDRAKMLTQQLLTFAKGGAPVRRPTRLGDLIRDAAGFSLRGSDVRCEFSIPADLWPADVDAGQLGQVISNLVINADEAMPGGGTIRVNARNLTPEAPLPGALPPGRYVEIAVEDQGIGIPEEHLARIFDPYFTTKRRGSGLGLATSYTIVRKHDGQLSVRSASGQGSCFTVTLPASTREPPPADRKEAAVTGHGRILVMDDEATIRDVCSQILVQMGYQVQTASDGQKAVEAFATALSSGRPFDAVIVDLTVPGGMGGTEALRRLLEIDPEARVIVSSGYSNDPIMADFRSHGFQGVVAKPYELRTLGTALKEVLGGPFVATAAGTGTGFAFGLGDGRRPKPDHDAGD
jgi:PAS domain S-box-containing protein